MNQPYMRTRQYLLSKIVGILPERKPKLVKGTDSLLRIPELLKKEGISRVEIITTAGFIKRGTLQGLFEKGIKALKDKKIPLFFFILGVFVMDIIHRLLCC